MRLLATIPACGVCLARTLRYATTAETFTRDCDVIEETVLGHGSIPPTTKQISTHS